MSEIEGDESFIETLITLIDETAGAIDSAHMSDAFLVSLGESLGEIPNMADPINSAENHANTPNTP